ncbi:MAG TPA: YciI-like protein [Acidimicrobiia bacterium]|nr:YciI-like protein [Acidimicrobiia bacterium]
MTDTSIVRYFVLMYEVVDDYARKRLPYRAQHLRLAAEFRRRGEFVMGGAIGDPPDRALLIFHGDRSVAEGFAARDPYVQARLVQRWEVQPWAVIPGEVFDNLRG